MRTQARKYQHNGQGQNGKRQKAKQPKILASATITGADTEILEDDLYNEPTRRRLDSGQEWVRFLDQRDSFLKNLMALVNYSPTLRRIIHDKVSMITGDGFIPIEGRANTLLTSLSTLQQTVPIEDGRLEELEESLQSVNLHRETLVDVLAKVAYEYEAFGNAFVEIVRGRGILGEFAYLYHVPLYMIGLRKAGVDMIIRSAGIYDQWESVNLTAKEGTLPEGFREIPFYPEWSEQGEDGTERTIIHIKQYSPGFFYWGMPEWISAQFWAEIEYRIAKFNINEFQNGFNFSAIVQLFGSVSQEEAKDIINSLQAKFTDTGNARKMFFQILRDEKLKANVQPLTDIKDGHFMDLQQLASQAIVSANRWTMSLAGFATSGKLGTNQQIRQETEYVQNTVVKPRQNVILSRIINPYLSELAEWTSASWIGISVGISTSMPVSFVGDLLPEKALLINEKREVMGYEPLDDEAKQTLLSEQRETSPLAISALSDAGKEVSATTEDNETL